MSAIPIYASSRSRYLIVPGVVWFGVILSLSAQGAFAIGPADPPLGLALAALGPPLIVMLALRWSETARAAAKALDPAFLTIVQSWRVLGGLFLGLLAFGQLPGLFAWPAGLGDVAVGLAAPFVVLTLIKQPGFIKTANYRWFHYLGIFDFMLAFATATLAGGRFPSLIDQVTSAPMGYLPLAMIPAFLVPLFLIVHVLALYQAKHA